RHRGGQQSVLVERGRKVFQQRARDQDWRGGSADGVVAIQSAATGHERQIVSQSGISDELGGNLQLRRLASVFQTVRRRWLEKCLSTAQLGRIFPRLQRDRAAGDDVAGGSEVR